LRSRQPSALLTSRTFLPYQKQYPFFSATGWGVLVAPLNTPQAIIQKVSADLSQVTSQSDLEKNLAELGSYTRTMTPAETTAFVHQQQNIWNPVLADIAQKQQK
jgi:tripartite-type tricarboxylate transporter receptor subunit TctC